MLSNCSFLTVLNVEHSSKEALIVYGIFLGSDELVSNIQHMLLYWLDFHFVMLKILVKPSIFYICQTGSNNANPQFLMVYCLSHSAPGGIFENSPCHWWPLALGHSRREALGVLHGENHRLWPLQGAMPAMPTGGGLKLVAATKFDQHVPTCTTFLSNLSLYHLKCSYSWLHHR